MKIAVVSNIGNESRALKGSYTYKEMVCNPRGPYDPGMVWLQNDSGLIHGLQADFFNVMPGMHDPNIKKFDEYDIIWTMRPFLDDLWKGNKLRDDQIYIYYEVEPWVLTNGDRYNFSDVDYSGWNSGPAYDRSDKEVVVKDQSQYIGPNFMLGDIYCEQIGGINPKNGLKEQTIYDAFCNPFMPMHEYRDAHIEKLNSIGYYPKNLQPERNIPFPLRWCISTIRDYCAGDYIKIKQKRRPKIWVSCRTVKFHTSKVNKQHRMGFPKDTSMFSDKYDYLWERCIDFDHDEYFKTAGECKYMINLDDAVTPGCLFADAACLGIIAFGRKGKQYFDLLYPPYCQVNSIDECYSKIQELEQDNNLYTDILNHIENQLKYIDHTKTLDFLEKDVLSKIKKPGGC